MQVLRRDDFPALPWKNGLGLSRVVAVHPEGADYDNLFWQVTTTEISADCPFSDLPDIDRHFMLIGGSGAQLGFGGMGTGVNLKPAVAAPFAPVAFRGDWKTECRLTAGPVQVLNVMARRGHASAAISVKRWGGAMLCVQRRDEVLLVMMLEGSAMLPGEVAPLRPNDTLLLDSGRGEYCQIESPQGVARVAMVRLATR